MYGGGWIGKTIEIIDREFGSIEGILGSDRTPKTLVGKKGIVIDAYDDAYDTSYPTGYERNTLIVEINPGEEVQIDSACVKENSKEQQRGTAS